MIDVVVVVADLVGLVNGIIVTVYLCYIRALLLGRRIVLAR